MKLVSLHIFKLISIPVHLQWHSSVMKSTVLRSLPSFLFEFEGVLRSIRTNLAAIGFLYAGGPNRSFQLKSHHLFSSNASQKTLAFLHTAALSLLATVMILKAIFPDWFSLKILKEQQQQTLVSSKSLIISHQRWVAELVQYTLVTIVNLASMLNMYGVGGHWTIKFYMGMPKMTASKLNRTQYTHCKVHRYVIMVMFSGRLGRTIVHPVACHGMSTIEVGKLESYIIMYPTAAQRSVWSWYSTDTFLQRSHHMVQGLNPLVSFLWKQLRYMFHLGKLWNHR